MDNLRKRVTFKVPEEGDGTTREVLDDQQQDAVIQDLQDENHTLNQQYLVALKVIVAMSTVLHVIYFQRNPLAMFSQTNDLNATLPLRPLFSLFNLIIHGSFTLLLFPNEIRQLLELSQAPQAPPFVVLYAVSCVAPILALCLEKPWQTVAWWLFTPAIVLIVQTTMDVIEQGNKSIAELQRLKYMAPGA